MSGNTFLPLFRWELQQTVRSKVLWTVLFVVGIAMLWASVTTAAFHRGQMEAQVRTKQSEARHMRTLEERRAAYSAPLTSQAPEVPYWQDPTNISGLSQYFVFKHAMKPHQPLSPLSVGVSDIAPTRLPIKVNTLFGFNDTYDFENPRGLALERFDLGFVLAVLLPVSLILIFGLLGTFERDRGMMRLIAAQSVSPRAWLGARFLALFAWVLPVIILEFSIALVAAGVSPAAAGIGLVAALLVLTGYVILWSGICVLVLRSFPGSSQALGQLAAIWTVLVVGAPLLWSFATSLADPAPSGVNYVNAMRRTADAVQAQAVKVVHQAFTSDPQLRNHLALIGQMDYATRLSFLVPETERRLQSLRSESKDYVQRQIEQSRLAGYVIPVLGMQETLAVLAGNDPQRHINFQNQARDYQLQLRGVLYPMVHREAVSPTPYLEPRPRGRFSAPAGDFLPSFQMRDLPPHASARSVLPFAVWTALLGLALFGVALGATRRWPASI